MKKKLLFGAFCLVILVIICFGKKYNVYQTNFAKDTVKNNNLLSMMLEQTAGAGDYKMSTLSTWPTDGYKFNSELSKCEKGSILAWNDEKKQVAFSGSVSDKCYLYFDKVSLISFSIEDVTYKAELGMTYKEWFDSEYNTFGYWFDNAYLCEDKVCKNSISQSDEIVGEVSLYIYDKLSINKYPIILSGVVYLNDGDFFQVNDADSMSKYAQSYRLNETILLNSNININYDKQRIMNAFKSTNFEVLFLKFSDNVISIKDMGLYIPGVKSTDSVTITYLDEFTDEIVASTVIWDDRVDISVNKEGIYIINKN